MLPELNNDILADKIKENPELEVIIQSIAESNKKINSMLVHELRNPLSLLKGTIQYIETKHPETSEFKYWDQIQELIGDMERLIQDASLMNNTTLLNRENINLIALMNQILDSFKPQALSRDIDLALEVAPGSEAYFNSYHCDGNKLKQVFVNIIKNAFEATRSGDFVHIRLACLFQKENRPAKLSICISNNGQPIPADALEIIFQPFVSYKKGGTGVGLALVKKVIDLHYGSVSVTSEEALTAFTILLPL
ncbi:signal transduction histidine kinase [Anaerotaenia torta]|uniref:ATP-binding protein n=1 Tax=Anaerotaenia torta TaxID=433293 RepID=UPI003D1D522B